MYVLSRYGGFGLSRVQLIMIIYDQAMRYYHSASEVFVDVGYGLAD